MDFYVQGLEASQFRHLFGKSDEYLARQGARAYIADAKPGFPCRVSLCEADPGQRIILLNYEHQPAQTPFRSSHAIFVRDGSVTASFQQNEVPDSLRIRQLSVRAFDDGDMMLDARLIEGKNAASCFRDMLSDPACQYLHVHNASRGCYLARINKSV